MSPRCPTLWAWLAGLALLVLPAGAPAQLWSTGYYPGYEQSAMPASAVDFGALTHVIHFSVAPKTNGLLDTTLNNITHSRTLDLVSRGHGAGKKVLISVAGSSAGGFAGATSSTNRAVFITQLTTFMYTNGYDGIDIDWEPLANADAPQYTNFIKELRLALNGYWPPRLLTVATATQPAWFAMLQSQFDQINLMTYSLSGTWAGWVTWFNSPLYDGAYRFPSTGGLVPSCEGIINKFIAAGVAPSKLGIGLAFYGNVWTGGTGLPSGGATGPRQSWTTAPTNSYVSYATVMSTYYQSNLYHWDAAAQSAYLSIDTANAGTDKFISYDDEAACQAKVYYARNHGLGGVMIWELGEAYRSSQPVGKRDPLLQAVKQALQPPAPPQISQCARQSDGSFKLTFSGTAGLAYRVRASTNLSRGLSSWDSLATNVFGSGLTNYRDASAGSAGRRFYMISMP